MGDGLTTGEHRTKRAPVLSLAAPLDGEDVMLAGDYVFWPAVALMAASNFYFFPRISNGRMAMQWDFRGRPTWSAPKAIGLWGMVIFALAVRLLIWAAMTYAPDTVHGAESGLLLFSLIVAASHVLMARAAMRAG